MSLVRSWAHFLERGSWEETEEVLQEARFVYGEREDMGVEMSRSFADFLYRQPVGSSRRMLVIHDAAECTPQAQSALLKIVEEPPAHALIVMTVVDVRSLLPALRSRMQAWYVAPAHAGAHQAKTPREERAQELVQALLRSSPDKRGALIKEMVAGDKEDDVEKGERITDTFLSALIRELAKKPEGNWRVLKEALKRQTAMADYSTSKKLQLEALLQFLP
jgi:hypothetical protein